MPDDPSPIFGPLPKPPRPITPQFAMERACDLIDHMFRQKAWPGTMSIVAREVRNLLEAAKSGKAVG